MVDFAAAWFPGHRTADIFGVDTIAWLASAHQKGCRPVFAVRTLSRAS